MANGLPISFGRYSSGSSESSDASSRAAAEFGRTISPSIVPMSSPRPSEWFETEPPAVERE